MHSLKLTLAFTLALCVSIAYGQQRAFDHKVTMTVNGKLVKGTVEIGLEAQASRNPGSVYDQNPPPIVAPGQSFQATVSVTDPSGVTTDYTGSPLRVPGVLHDRLIARGDDDGTG